ncbi:anti-sigma factor family protein [Salinispora arenicola]|uniref:anti-sigma factor family protein n=1 Tax=Salinispora arenicola TaxID=168697 RepID=UPI00037D0D6C|nr:zf-HC2 domain-containing protein [Salinispora arenicola]
MRRDHDDATIGAYLAGELPDRAREAFEAHLLTCDRCWAEVAAGRRGRELVHLARDPVPPDLAARLAGAVVAEQHVGPHHDFAAEGRILARLRGLRHRRTGGGRRFWALAAAALALVAALGAMIVDRDTAAVPAPQIAVAVAGYHDGRLPGTTIPARPGPDLSALRLSGAGASAGDLAGQSVSGYAYRDDTGRRLIIYVSDEPFPVSTQAENAIGSAGAGMMRLDDVVVLCSRRPHTALVLGDDEELVRQAATTLDLI